MTGRIYLLNEGSDLVSLEEAPYDSERLLQEMLAEHPDILAGEQINGDEPRRWLLITREMAVPDEEDGPSRWSLDHLFLDQDAVPTLIEVKRGSNTDVRRKVVGQMLDYAANAVVYWPVEEIRAKFETRCERNDEDAEEVLAAFLSTDEDTDEFWHQVKTNLQAGRVRMVFVADLIPPELRRVVEFLNEQMDPAEVLAVEVKQFVGQGVKTLVPRVLGQTETARQKKASSTSSGSQWNESSFMAALEEQFGVRVRETAEDLLHWVTPMVSYAWFGKGKTGGVVPTIQRGKIKYHVCRMSTKGVLSFQFKWLRKKSPFHEISMRKQLLDRVNEIPGVQFNADVMEKAARIRLELLSGGEARQRVKSVMTWLIEQIKTQPD
ncbi:MAG: hypothetical protein KDA20_05340 [Phycisphaerales bacterium]|nr:hypothetical protein [Phycisphaerales bacterium]